MRKLLVAMAALLTLSLGGIAGAADMARPVLKATPPAPVYNWTGCYVAGGGGYGLYDINHVISSPGPEFDPAQASNNSGRGSFGTLGVGCDLQFSGPLGGNWVIGVLADYDWMNIKGNYTTNCPSGCEGPFSFTGQLKARNAGYVGARIGGLVTPHLLAYVSGGWTEMRFSGAVLPSTFDSDEVAALPAHTVHGWFVGGGTEYALGWLPGLFWRTEYRFADYRSRSTVVACVSGGCDTLPGINAIDNAHPRVQTVRSELVWRFNWGAR